MNCPVKEGTLKAKLTRSHSLARMGGLASIPPVPGRRRRRRPKRRRRSKRQRRLVRRRWRDVVEGAPRRRRERRRAANELASRSHVRGGHRALGQDRGEALARGGAHGTEGAHAIALGRKGSGRRGRRWERWGRRQTSEGGDRPRDAAPHVRRRDQEHGDAAAVLYASVLNLAVDAVMARCQRDDSPPVSGDMLFNALERKRRAARRLVSAAGEECEPPRLLFSSFHGRIAAALAGDEGSAGMTVTTSMEPFREAATAQTASGGARPVGRSSCCRRMRRRL